MMPHVMESLRMNVITIDFLIHKNAIITRIAMKKGQPSYFYHSNCKPPGIAGIVDIVKGKLYNSKIVKLLGHFWTPFYGFLGTKMVNLGPIDF